GERLRSTHATTSTGEGEGAREGALKTFAGNSGKRFKGALQNALRTDVDPRAGGHLPVHHEPLSFEFAKLGPRRPISDKVGVCEEDSGSPLVRAEHSDGFTRLHKQGFVVSEVAEGVNDGVERFPASRC